MKPRTQHRLILVGLLVAILLFIGLSIYGFSRMEYTKKPVVEEKVAQQDTQYLYNFYVSGTPTITNRAYYGAQNASITIIAYLDLHAPSTKKFFQDIYPQIANEYINTGKAKLIIKNYITAEDVAGKTDTYAFAASLACVNRISPARYYEVYFLFVNTTNTTNITAIPHVLEQAGIDQTAFGTCINQEAFPEVLEDVSEIDNFGMLGIAPRFYIGLDGKENTIIDGIPKYAKFKKTIREYQLIIGD
jgi:protein-disulfide isomerase